MDCEVLKIYIILHELLENSKINVNSRIKPSELKKKLKTQGKTQNLREKLNFSAYSYVGQGEKMAKLKACAKASRKGVSFYMGEGDISSACLLCSLMIEATSKHISTSTF